MSVKEHFDKAFSCSGEPLQADLERAEFIQAHVPEGVRTVLDVGCGMGIVTQVVAKEYEVTGLELSSVGVEKTSKLGIRCVQGSVSELPFSDKSFDLVMASEVFEHLDEEIFPNGLAEVARVASKHVLVTVPNKERYSSLRQECPNCRTICVLWTHIRSFDINSVRRLFDSLGFVCEQVQFFGPLVVDNNTFIARLLKLHRWFYNYLRPGTMCPVCKYEQPGPPLKRPTLGSLIEYPLLTCAYILDFLALKLSPKCHRWIFAVYKRY